MDQKKLKKLEDVYKRSPQYKYIYLDYGEVIEEVTVIARDRAEADELKDEGHGEWRRLREDWSDSRFDRIEEITDEEYDESI